MKITQTQHRTMSTEKANAHLSKLLQQSAVPVQVTARLVPNQLKLNILQHSSLSN
jgi:hypothetical protein